MDVVKPMLLQVVEWFSIGDIICYNDSICIVVVTLCDRTEAFLARSIPYLQLQI